MIDPWKLVEDHVQAIDFPDGARLIRDGIPCAACHHSFELCCCGPFRLASGAILFEVRADNTARFGYGTEA